jgi:glycerol-3-phosphate acyltransferase PlsY
MIAILVVLGYLLGSIPVAWLVARAVTGKDLRQLGSGNVGVMNTALSVARWAGLLVFLAEAAKGATAVYLAQHLDGSEVATVATALAAVAGTRWSIWLRGAGGRGNTVGVTAILLLFWPMIVIGLAMWTLARLATRRSFMATRVCFVAWPFIFGALTRSWWYLLFAAALSLMYLSTQRPETDDHLLVKKRWPNMWAFLTGPRRS